MKVLEVIHGYPPEYNAGSEVYTQTIARGIIKAGHEVAVFTHEENPYRPDFDIRLDNDLQAHSIRIMPGPETGIGMWEWMMHFTKYYRMKDLMSSI
jgi:hypothetical protein